MNTLRASDGEDSWYKVSSVVHNRSLDLFEFVLLAVSLSDTMKQPVLGGEHSSAVAFVSICIDSCL